MRRLLGAVPAAFAVVVVTFLMIRLVPGDPVQVMAGTTLDPESTERIRAQLGLDKSLLRQFIDYVGGLMRGDLGESYITDQAVNSIVRQRIPNTLKLTFGGLLAALIISLPLGVIAGIRDRRQRGAKVGFTVATTLLVATPDFLLATILSTVFAVYLTWFPVAGADSWDSIVLPALALGIPLAGVQARVIRSGVSDAQALPFVRTLRAAGAPERTVIARHILPNASIPLITLLSVEFGRLLAGALIVESIFAWPGLGSTLFDSIGRRDFPAVQGEILVIALMILVVNLLIDIAYRLIDPRIEYES